MNTEQLKYFMSGIVFASFIMAVVSFIAYLNTRKAHKEIKRLLDELDEHINL